MAGTLKWEAEQTEFLCQAQFLSWIIFEICLYWFFPFLLTQTSEKPHQVVAVESQYAASLRHKRSAFQHRWMGWGFAFSLLLFTGLMCEGVICLLHTAFISSLDCRAAPLISLLVLWEMVSNSESSQCYCLLPLPWFQKASVTSSWFILIFLLSLKEVLKLRKSLIRACLINVLDDFPDCTILTCQFAKKKGCGMSETVYWFWVYLGLLT